MNPKSMILSILKQRLGNAEDDLHRAEVSFRGMTTTDLNRQHGESGQTRMSVLTGYQNECNKISRCILWLDEVEE